MCLRAFERQIFKRSTNEVNGVEPIHKDNWMSINCMLFNNTLV